jgi:hypothetical protein
MSRTTRNWLIVAGVAVVVFLVLVGFFPGTGGY